MAVLSQRRDEPSEQRLETEAAFVAASAALLLEGRSYADLSVEEISRRAGRSRTAFYFYFRDKRELLIHALQDAAERLYVAADSWWSGPGRPDDLRRALEDVFDVYSDERAVLGAVIEASGYDESIRELWRDVIGRFVVPTEERLRAEGEPAASARAKAFALVWMTERTFYQHLGAEGTSDISDRALLDSLVEIWVRSAYRSPP